MDEEERDDLTLDEESEEKYSEMDGEETHRYEEFADLRDRVESLADSIDSLRDLIESGFKTISEGMGVMVDNGATVIEDDDDNGVDDDLETDYFDLGDLNKVLDLDLD